MFTGDPTHVEFSQAEIESRIHQLAPREALRFVKELGGRHGGSFAIEKLGDNYGAIAASGYGIYKEDAEKKLNPAASRIREIDFEQLNPILNEQAKEVLEFIFDKSAKMSKFHEELSIWKISKKYQGDEAKYKAINDRELDLMFRRSQICNLAQFKVYDQVVETELFTEQNRNRIVGETEIELEKWRDEMANFYKELTGKMPRGYQSRLQQDNKDMSGGGPYR